MSAAEIALLVSFGSLVVSSLGFYFTHLRPGIVVGNLGFKAHIYHPRDRGTGIYVHVNFVNPTRVRAMVRSAVLEITGPAGHHHYLAWQRRSKIEATGEYTDVADAGSFFVEPQANARDLFWFWWGDDVRQPLLFQRGKYSFCLHYWINKEEKPRTSPEQTLTIDEPTSVEMLRRHRDRDPRTWIQPFDRHISIGVFTQQADRDWWRRLKPLE